jgi:hypothetical protein
MLSTETIAELSEKAARNAAKKHLLPYVPWDAGEVRAYTSFPFPSIGSYRPKGWKLLSYVTADGTGLGEEWEPALTIRGLKTWCANRIEEHPGRSVGFAIIEAGEFQAVVGAFLREQ